MVVFFAVRKTDIFQQSIEIFYVYLAATAAYGALNFVASLRLDKIRAVPDAINKF